MLAPCTGSCTSTARQPTLMSTCSPYRRRHLADAFLWCVGETRGVRAHKGPVMQKRARRGGMVVALAVGAVLGVVSCRSDRAAPVLDTADASATTASSGASVLAESADARNRV